ncbi:hypothetical protein COY95_01930, partial [Candidatus Woesearchaeota archaeon CG_4_10_14_0_8_um_filter_47_5]
NAHTVVLSTEFVDVTSGSGLVHCAPGCGPEDYEVGHANDIPPLNTLDTKGVFSPESGPFAGMRALKDDPAIIETIKKKGALVAVTPVEHEYPHDWRHHQPVIFRTTKQWFFKVEDMKEEMIAANKEIRWIPDAAFNAFDAWLRNLRDNSISKQRYWGTPIPIWRNVTDEKDYLVIGSAQELEKLSGKKVGDDLHISFVDSIEIQKDGRTYRRIPDILDVWVDAGTASWNCLNFPREKKTFEQLFPATFILEGKDQIRGWFNLLHVASMVALGRISFKNCYMHGFVQDAEGRKMSKSLGNYILPSEVIEKQGADTLRYYMIGGANPAMDLNYNSEDMGIKFRNLNVLWNLYHFLIDFAHHNNIRPSATAPAKSAAPCAEGVEERYILSKLHSTIRKATAAHEAYLLNQAPLIAESLFLELSRTYVQSVREKSASGTDEEKQTILDTLFIVLLENLKLLAPVVPFVTEAIYLNLREAFSLEEESIHLMAWPAAGEGKIDEALEKDMETSKAVIQAVLAAREKAGYGVRWPLQEAIIISTNKETESAV